MKSVSFSGGESSGMMAAIMKQQSNGELCFIFANTGQENEETLEFVQRCDQEFALGVVWVEAVVNADNIGTTHKVVSFATASRHGEPFEQVIRKYGISNQAYPHCTRELKLAPMQSYMRSICANYTAAIGIRADEYRRVQDDSKIIYPLVDRFITKDDVKEFWDKQPFRLELKSYQGNCKWCWKKSLRKHFKLIAESPGIYDFPRDLEAKYGKVRCPEGRRVFFRNHMSTDDLFAARGTRYQLSLLDIDDGCAGSCEVYATV